MQAYLARRLLALIPALFFASLIVFVIVRLVPGSIIDMIINTGERKNLRISRSTMARNRFMAPAFLLSLWSREVYCKVDVS